MRETIEKILCIGSIWPWGHYLSGICSVFKLLTIVTTSKFHIVWGSKSIGMSGIMLEPGLIDSACQCLSTHLCECSSFWWLKTWLYFPSSILAWFGPCDFLVSENDITAMGMPFPKFRTGSWPSYLLFQQVTSSAFSSCRNGGLTV